MGFLWKQTNKILILVNHYLFGRRSGEWCNHLAIETKITNNRGGSSGGVQGLLADLLGCTPLASIACSHLAPVPSMVILKRTKQDHLHSSIKTSTISFILICLTLSRLFEDFPITVLGHDSVTTALYFRKVNGLGWITLLVHCLWVDWQEDNMCVCFNV